MDRMSLAHLVAEAALAAGVGDVIERSGTDWVLRDVAGGEAGIRVGGAPPRLVLSRAIGPLPRHDRMRACEMLLTRPW